MMTTRPVLGVLGGMGPAATADFLHRLARLTPAQRDQDHIPTVVYSDPQTPDRSDAILGVGTSPLPAMLRGVEFLNRAGCALIAIPCNSAHYWYDEVARASDVPVLHIVDAAVDAIKQTCGATRVGIMATDGTIRAGIYHARLRALGLAALDLVDQGAQNPVMRAIRELKAGRAETARELLLTAGEELVRRGAEALVLGCTDVSVALSETPVIATRPVLDASDCLAAASVQKMVGTAV